MQNSENLQWNLTENGNSDKVLLLNHVFPLYQKKQKIIYTSKKNEKERRKKKRTNRRIGMLQMAPLFQRPKLALLLLHIHYSYSMI